MRLINQETKGEFEAEIVKIEKVDYKIIKESEQFEFEWKQEQDNTIFKIIRVTEHDSEILGLLSIIDIPTDLRIHINLIENSNDNKGKLKKVDRIAGCLLAFAAQLAFEKGYFGFVSLIPKTELIELYIGKYGFSRVGRQLAIERQVAIRLIQKYL